MKNVLLIGEDSEVDKIIRENRIRVQRGIVSFSKLGEFSILTGKPEETQPVEEPVETQPVEEPVEEPEETQPVEIKTEKRGRKPKDSKEVDPSESKKVEI